MFQRNQSLLLVSCPLILSGTLRRFSLQVTTDTNDRVDDADASLRAPSPVSRPLLPGTMRPLSPSGGPRIPLDPQGSQDLASKKKKGLLSKGRKLLKRLSPVK